MFKGAIILGVGFSLGYAKAMHDTDAVVNGISRIIAMLDESAKARKAEQEKQKKQPSEPVVADPVGPAVTPEPTHEGE